MRAKSMPLLFSDLVRLKTVNFNKILQPRHIHFGCFFISDMGFRIFFTAAMWLRPQPRDPSIKPQLSTEIGRAHV